mmetsp:Transcript_65689/g.212710  ORF Transcript_65689/g.212710 Transcript_65689/m.212710 type:complete len:535 (+) Transcript_65689:171-1775(+)
MAFSLAKTSILSMWLASWPDVSGAVPLLAKTMQRRGSELAPVAETEALLQHPRHAPHARKRQSLLQQQARDSPKDAGWFGSFDQMESTDTEEGIDANLNQNPGRLVQFGYEAGYEPPAAGKALSLKSSAWFHESPSAGQADAWQTHFPAAGGSIAGNRGANNNAWRDTPEGWVQNYNPSTLVEDKSSGIGRQPAQWFDSSVLNFDGFGRRSLPYPGTPRRLLDSAGAEWVEQAVNTTVACKEIGCTANASLQAYNPAEQEATLCRLSIHVHATDFDDEWSREHIDFWKVNGLLARAECDPMARGCNASASRPLYSCLQDMPVDHILDPNGTLLIQGRINKMVDECPFEGNLLSGVAAVTCMVRNKTALAEEAPFPQLSAPASKAVPSVSANATIRCSEPGCSAVALINLDPTVAMMGGTCLMNITVVQTDFDDDLGLPEDVEFIKMDGAGSIVSNMQPGKNPCTARFQGNPLSEDELLFSLLTNYNVTEQMLAPPAGSIRLMGKISEQVDECASEGFLLDARVVVRCDPPRGLA